MAIIDGYIAQKKWDNKGLALIASIEVDTDDEHSTAEGAGDTVHGLTATTTTRRGKW